MHSNVIAKSAPTLPVASVAELRSQALKERCALTVEARMIDILCADAEESERSQAILDIAIARNDLPHIQARSCRDLSIMDPSRARELVRYLLKESPSDERDMVRARAFATLAELPNLTEQEVIAVAHGLKDRFPIVREHVGRAIQLLPADRFRMLQAMVERLADHKGLHVVALRDFVARVVPGVGESTEPDFKGRVRVNEASPKDSQQPTPKLIRERASTARAVRDPVIQRGPPAKVCGRQASHSSAQRMEASRTNLPDRRVSVSTQPPAAVSLSQPSLSPRSEVSSASVSIEGLRRGEFAGMTWAELRIETERSDNPRTLSACIAEMAVRFGKDATLQVTSGQLCFVASHADPEIKAMSASLSAYLFGS